MLSTSWQTAALMAPQDHDYRAFIIQLHARMKQAASHATLTGGLRPRIYAAAVVMLALVAIAMAGLFIRAVATGEWAGAVVSGRLRRVVCLADRRLRGPQPAANLHLRRLAGGVAAIGTWRRVQRLTVQTKADLDIGFQQSRRYI